MRIICLSMVKNEQDIIEPFLRAHSPFFDAILIIDNASSDKTREIIVMCARELGNIIIGDSEIFNYTQSERMTRMLEYCQTAFFADCVLFLDADEFISLQDRASFEMALKGIPKGGVGYLPWRTFVITPGEEDAIARDPPRNFTSHRLVETPQFYKAVLRLDGAWMPRIVVKQGNHDVQIDGALPEKVKLTKFPLLHFPIRSGAQLASKGVNGWMAYLGRDPNARNEMTGFQWREAFDLVAEKGTIALTEGVAEASISYAQSSPTSDWRSNIVIDRPLFAYERKYSTGAFADPLALVARSWERTLAVRTPLVKLKRPVFDENASSEGETAFDAKWHWDSLFFDIPPFRYIAEKYSPESVLDIGCGIGQYLALFKSLGTKTVFGVDGIPAAAVQGVLEPEDYSVRNLTEPLTLGRRFDIVVCVEVIEHIPEASSSTLLDSIDTHATNLIIFSAAEPLQPGNGHINCRPLAEWLDHWAERGWIPHLADSLGMRALATMSWFRRNLVVLKRGSRGDGAHAIKVLVEIASKDYVWYGQDTCIVEYPFGATPPQQAIGYDAKIVESVDDLPRKNRVKRAPSIWMRLHMWWRGRALLA